MVTQLKELEELKGKQSELINVGVASQISVACPRWDSVGQVSCTATKYFGVLYPEMLE